MSGGAGGVPGIPDAGPPVLAHEVVGRGERRVLFLHGILGSRTNWRGFARRLVELRPGWSVVLADLRNHGDSRGFAPPHDMDACASDVARLASLIGPYDVVVGHSFGGKVALAFTLGSALPPPSLGPPSLGPPSLGPPSLREVWVLDAPPGLRSLESGGREEVAGVLDAVRAVVLPVESRRALVDLLRGRGLPDAIATWMTTNLRPVEQGFVWRFELAAVPEMLAAFGALDLWPALEAHTGSPRIVMVRAGRSNRWSGEERARLVRAAARGQVVEHVMTDAGHWLHTDDPEGLLALLLPALDRVEQEHARGARG